MGWDNIIQCNLTATTIYNREKNLIEVVYVFQEMKKRKRKNIGQAYYTFDKIIEQDESFMKIIQYAKKYQGFFHKINSLLLIV